jgi:hypothetical protein
VRAVGPVETTSAPGRDTLSIYPGTRTPTVLMFESGAPTSSSTGARALRSDGGLDVHYRVDASDGGSGGAEAIVLGEVHTKHGTVRLRCWAQAESEEPEQRCLDVLATLSEL